jgi:anti-sigma B factor antagonist
VDRLEITARTEGGRRVLSVAGEIDMATGAQFTAAIADNLAADGPLVLDLTGVSFLDSSGLWTLLKANKDAIALGVQLCIAVSEPIARVLELARVEHVLATYPDRAAALDGCA